MGTSGRRDQTHRSGSRVVVGRPFATPPFSSVYVVQRGLTTVLPDCGNTAALGCPIKLASGTNGQPVAVVMPVRPRSPSFRQMPHRSEKFQVEMPELLPEQSHQSK